MIDTSSTQYFVAGWTVVLFSIWILSKYEGTRTLLYYLFWLGIVLDLVTHSEDIWVLYTIIFNVSGQATIGEEYIPGTPIGGGPGPGTNEHQPGNGTVKHQPGGPVKTQPGSPVKSLPSIIENYIF